MRVLATLILMISATCFSMDVYIVAGQSNAVGSGYVSQYPSEIVGVDPRALTYNYQTDVIEPLKVGTNSNLLHGWGGKFGPELAIRNNLLDKTEGEFLILKYAYSGSSLFEDWNARNNGFLHEGLMNTLDDLRVKLAQRSETMNVKAMFWMQGESDLTDMRLAFYQGNLTEFIESVREKVQRRKLPFIIAQVAGHKNEENILTMHAIQQAFVESDKYARMIPTDDIEVGADNLHYNGDGLLQLGDRFFDMYWNTDFTIRLNALHGVMIDPNYKPKPIKPARISLKK